MHACLTFTYIQRDTRLLVTSCLSSAGPFDDDPFLHPPNGKSLSSRKQHQVNGFHQLSFKHVQWLEASERFWKSFTLSRLAPSLQKFQIRRRRQWRRSPISSLPQDLLIIIAELLISRKDQLAFIKTCRAFQEPGLRALYAHIQVDAFEADEDRILATLFHRPDLTKYIRSYSGPLHIFLHPSALVWHEIINLGSKPVPPEGAPEGYFPIIFEHAKGIRELEILRYSPGTFGERTSAMLCQLPLTRFSIRQGTETMPLSKILRALPSVRHLQLRGVHGDWDVEELTREDLPNLQSLAAPVRPSRLLVPGRPVDSIMIDFSGYGDQVDEDLWLKLSQSSARVVKLDLLPRRSDQELELAVAYLPGIRHLRLREQYFKVPEVSKNLYLMSQYRTNHLNLLVVHRSSKQSVISRIWMSWILA